MNAKGNPVFKVSCTLALLLIGCASVPPIEPANTSKSAFDGAVYSGTLVTVSTARPATEAYRVFIKGGTGFITLQSVRRDAEERAEQFCDRKGRSMETLTEHTSNPPYIFGNFPRIEIVFDCIERQNASTAIAGDAKYTKLVDLKTLLDSGVITQTEFVAEKAKILGGP